MPNYLSGELIRELRRRKGWQQAYLQELSSGSEGLVVTLSRAENLRRQPTGYTMSKFLDLLGMPTEQFFCPYLENNSAESGLMRNRLLFYLDKCEDDADAWGAADRLVTGLANTLDMDSVINRQFILSSRARLSVAAGETAAALALVKEGLSLTYPEFDESSFTDEMLIFDEVDVLHTLALVYIKQNRSKDAENLLDRVHTGFLRLTQKTAEKEKKLPKVLRELVHCLIQSAEYEKALDISERGLRIAIERSVGRYVPDFAYAKARCMFYLDMKEYPSFLRYAYFSYALLGMKNEMTQLLRNAHDLFGVNIDTYGVENLTLDTFSEFTTIAAEFAASGSNIGDVIRQLRTQAGLKPKDIYSGLCTRSNYSMIESGQVKQVGTLLLRAIFGRLGRDMDVFFTVFSSKDEIDDMHLRSEISGLTVEYKFDEVAKLVLELAGRKSSKQRLGQQFLKCAEAIVLRAKEGFVAPVADLFLEAIKITIPDFDEEKISTYRLTVDETACVSALGIYYKGAGDLRRSRAIYQQLLESLKSYCVDEPSLIAYYINTLLNYSNCLLVSDMHEEANRAAREAHALCIRYGRFYLLGAISGNNARALLNMGLKEESLPYFAMGYYSARLLEEKESYDDFKDEAKNTFGISFEG